MQVNDVIFTVKEGMVYKVNEDTSATCGINLYLNHFVVAEELEMRKIMTREILENLFGDVVQRLNKIDHILTQDVVAGRDEVKKLIHDMRF